MKRPHLLGVDDGPHVRDQREPVPIVGVMMEGAHLLESVAITEFPVDGENVTDFLAEWIASLRLHPTLDAVILGELRDDGRGAIHGGVVEDNDLELHSLTGESGLHGCANGALLVAGRNEQRDRPPRGRVGLRPAPAVPAPCNVWRLQHRCFPRR